MAKAKMKAKAGGGASSVPGLCLDAVLRHGKADALNQRSEGRWTAISADAFVEQGGAMTAPTAPQSQSQYYCPDSGYYPSVQTCPRGWLRVVPGSPPQR